MVATAVCCLRYAGLHTMQVAVAEMKSELCQHVGWHLVLGILITQKEAVLRPMYVFTC